MCFTLVFFSFIDASLSIQERSSPNHAMLNTVSSIAVTCSLCVLSISYASSSNREICMLKCTSNFEDGPRILAIQNHVIHERRMSLSKVSGTQLCSSSFVLLLLSSFLRPFIGTQLRPSSSVARKNPFCVPSRVQHAKGISIQKKTTRTPGEGNLSSSSFFENGIVFSSTSTLWLSKSVLSEGFSTSFWRLWHFQSPRFVLKRKTSLFVFSSCDCQNRFSISLRDFH